ncbi:glycosyltransferase family 4 protein [Candidatus Albibeggiatoa sp. nov. BB20]|uniref:glycosyltransferase family 4 protein n=1 Tax=Candidatus Albibeggiatoa sp. nov. BB20 TaxID=3162723 RepID=UPI0033658812
MDVPLYYILHSSNLYGTEKMALATLESLRSQYRPVLLTPPGVVVEEAQRRGISVHCFSSYSHLIKLIRSLIAEQKQLVFMSTGVRYSLILWGWNLFYRRKIIHLQMVHGGADEWHSYGRKWLLNPFCITFIVNSKFVYQKLLYHRVKANKIQLIENFLTEQQILNSPKHPEFKSENKLQNIIVVSRIDPLKRVDLLLQAIRYDPRLKKLQFNIYGMGTELPTLRRQAMICCPNVQFCNYIEDISHAVAEADLLLHLCPSEPFGLAVLEAMAARVPVLVPNTGGVASLVQHEISGFHFQANDVKHLAQTLLDLSRKSMPEFNEVTQQAYLSLETRFSEQHCQAEYIALLNKLIQD